MKITAELLATNGACADQVAIVAKEWPDGAEPTEAALLRAVELGLSIWWLRGLLPMSLRAKYDRQEAPLWAEYRRQEAALLAEYDRQAAALWAEYRRQAEPLWAECDRQEVALLATYQAGLIAPLARAFAEL